MNDDEIFVTNPEQLLEAIRLFSLNESPKDHSGYLLQRCGLVLDGQLTAAGESLFKLRHVLRQNGEAELALGRLLRQLTPIQVIEQETRGLGAVPEEGVLDLLRKHRAAGRITSISDLRPTLIWLNKLQVLTYSKKFKTVRIEGSDEKSPNAGEVKNMAAMISPQTPFLNVVRLRRLLRSLGGTVIWADPHFGARALEELAEETDTARVKEIRILSGNDTNVLTERSRKDFDRFSSEMALKGVQSEWRYDSLRDWHDRWLISDAQVWNVPPVNTLFKNDYSEILPASQPPPIRLWWDRSTPRP
ncbi:hypothetical protein GCM10022223_38040 [Kineosporia mesophila]|uniref:Uncharacterized protein n=1 Tax=Kineosporia mesophila TaxID=566012 RepID=A0ABP6ZSJ9_9ACTN|nr:hypothetical protein [Kineosporia mesophila]MCD5349774.1 hypothetical protein [Kineosporia mesophila]